MTNGESQGTPEWIRAIVRQYESRLVGYAARITGDVERARDVVQETFLKLCEPGSPREAGYLAQWLFTVCRNGALDVRRREKQMCLLNEKHAENMCSENPAPSAVLERSESVGGVLKALETLPENQQEVVRLKFQGGLSYREISVVTGLSVTNVGFLIHTGLKTIRGMLAVGKDDNGGTQKQIK